MDNITDVRVDQGLQLRPAGQNRAAKTFHSAREDILSIMKKHIFTKNVLFS